MWSRSIAVGFAALALSIAACESSDVTQPAALADVDRIELHAWRETLGPSYPLTLTGVDTAATVVAFFAPNDGNWRQASEFPGTPILAAFFSDNVVLGEYGFVEISHQQGGFLVHRENGRIRVRSATPSDITRFLAFFDLSVEFR